MLRGIIQATADIAKIGIGRDAADVSFLTSYGVAEMKDKSVKVHRIGG